METSKVSNQPAMSPALNPLQTAAAAAEAEAEATSTSPSLSSKHQPEEDNGSITPSPTNSNMDNSGGGGDCSAIVDESQHAADHQPEEQNLPDDPPLEQPPNDSSTEDRFDDNENNSTGGGSMMADDQELSDDGAALMADQVMEMAQEDFPADADDIDEQIMTMQQQEQKQQQQQTGDNTGEPAAAEAQAPNDPTEMNSDGTEVNENKSNETDQGIMDHSNSSTMNQSNVDTDNHTTDSNNEDSKQAAAAAAPAPPPVKRVPEAEVIDLLDSDDDDDNDDEDNTPEATVSKKPRLEHNSVVPSAAASAAAFASYQQRANYHPSWMKSHAPLQPAVATSRGIPGMQVPQTNNPPATDAPTVFRRDHVYNQPHFLKFPPGFKPTWRQVTPPPPAPAVPPQQRPASAINGPKVYQLSLLNVSEFTIEGLPASYGDPPTSITGLRVPIRQISRKHGKSVYERDKQEGGGKWRIPLGAYHDFASYLQSEPGTRVYGIPPNQLQIASLERARQEKGYPEPDKLIEYGVPKGLASALAPFQRGGVDFVKEKNGRALIADEMGLGKTIQGIASMSIFHNEWPLLVLCPSGARYHWENEFKQWLGADSAVNKEEKTAEMKCFPDCAASLNGQLMKDWQINVLTSSKSHVLPRNDIKVVICSYGLAPTLIESGAIKPRMFRCAIVDESHMLKNKSTKRTRTLLPILSATDRCVLLSGTPALSRPLELWPQLAILKTERHGWGDSESEFIDKYVKNGNSLRSAELHTMLRGTVMIRRLKNDILKTMPRKIREKATIYVLTSQEQRAHFKELMSTLRESKGAMGNLARTHHAEMTEMSEAAKEHERTLMSDNAANTELSLAPSSAAFAASKGSETEKRLAEDRAVAQKALRDERRQRYYSESQRIKHTLDNDPRYMHLDPDQLQNIEQQMNGMLITNLDKEYRAKWDLLALQHEQKHAHMMNEAENNKRTTALTQLYSLTGDVKIPLIVSMLKRFLADKTKGKICIFAHHLSVLNAIRDGVGLSNEGNGEKYIRIDGSTLPKVRQEQINAFQTDSSIRVALLGITAAGVAVTLTASSTVWFAELFWTPAIMIQAEDRCHRIGQSAQVKCLYFVARGTLDDILWKLIEKKFRDLGEFVEGKEKLKLVVDKEYNGVKDLQSALFHVEEEGSDEEDGMGDSNDDQDFLLDGDLVHDIEELGEEEQRMLHQSEETDDGDGDGDAVQPVNLDDCKMPAKTAERSGTKGLTEDDAIALSDDEDDENPPKPAMNGVPVDKKPAAETLVASQNRTETVSDTVSSAEASVDDVLAGCRLYRIIFPDTRLGIEVGIHNMRVVVNSVTEERRQLLGEDSKPAVGDILVSIGTAALRPNNRLDAILHHLKNVLQNPPTELMFLEAPRFAALYKQSCAERREHAKQMAAIPAAALGPPPALPSKSNTISNGDSSEVIELLDD